MFIITLPDCSRKLKGDSRLISGFAMVFSSVLLFFSCSVFSVHEGKILRIQGSDTMLMTCRTWGEAFMRKNPDVSVYVEGGGTGLGVKKLITGEINICAASRTFNSSENMAIAEKYRRLGTSFLVAKDAICIYVHPSNPVKDLSIEQLRDIFSGQLTNWYELGGQDRSINVLLRMPSSGTYNYFKNHVLSPLEYTNQVKTFQTHQALIQELAKDSFAIGFGGIAHDSLVQNLKINGIGPTEESVRENFYPIARYLYLYVISEPRGIVKDFIGFAMSPEGQTIVKNSGFFPLWPTMTIREN